MAIQPTDDSVHLPGFFKESWAFGGVNVSSRLILAPMDGYTDSAFRQICRRLGSGYSVSEFLDTNDVLHNTLSFKRRSKFIPAERPLFLQLLGDDPAEIAACLPILAALEPDGLDLNFGCPSRHVCSRGAGAALLKNPEKVGDMLSRLVSGSRLPVSAKIRLGWDDMDLNYLQIARLVEASGACLLAVHARTRRQGYTGDVNLPAVREVKQALHIPVVANGNIQTTADVRGAFQATGADAVMIGRAAVTNPWIFSLRNRWEVDHQEVKVLVLEHLQLSLEHYDYPTGLINFRKFAKGYLKPYQGANNLFPVLMRTLDQRQFINLTTNFLDACPPFAGRQEQ